MTQHPSKQLNPEKLNRSPNRAWVSFRAGPVEFDADINITPAGLVSIGGLVSMILLSVPPIIRAAKRRGPPAD